MPEHLHLPARMATLGAAGVPMIQFDNRGAVVGAQALAQRLGIGVFFDSIDDLARQLHDSECMAVLRERVWHVREQFCFDGHAPGLVHCFERVIACAGKQGRARGGGQVRAPGRTAASVRGR